MRRPILLVLSALAVAACSPEYDPASKLEKLRVLAIQAEPPEIDPAGAQTAALTSLVLRADFQASPLRTTTVVHAACVPVPGSPVATPCELLVNLKDPAATVAESARQACAGGPPGGGWPAIDLAGVESCAGVTCGPALASGAPLPRAQVAIPAGFTFPASGPERIIGVDAVVLAFAVDATPDELVTGVGTTCPVGDLAANLAALWSTREHVLSMKRVAIRGPDSPNLANRNPAVDGILLGATAVDPAGGTTVQPGEHQVAPLVPSGAAGQPEVYVKLDAAGVPIETATEPWVYSWFATTGELDHLHTRGSAETDPWTIGDSQGRARVAVVVRDLRGGTAWAVREVGLAP